MFQDELCNASPEQLESALPIDLLVKLFVDKLTLQTREAMYQTLGCLIRNVGGFYGCTHLQSQLLRATTGNLDHLQSSHVRMLIRHVFIPLVKYCPVDSR